MSFDIALVDFTEIPHIYPTNNPRFFARYCIDLAPSTLPTLAPFETERAAHDMLIQLFGESQHRNWFPQLYTHPYATCRGCLGYKPEEELVQSYCSQCRERLVLL